jgi:hypothetical protein
MDSVVCINCNKDIYGDFIEITHSTDYNNPSITYSHPKCRPKPTDNDYSSSDTHCFNIISIVCGFLGLLLGFIIGTATSSK